MCAMLALSACLYRPEHREQLYAHAGLVAIRTTQEYHNWSTGTWQTRGGYELVFKGEKLCGENLTRRLYADAPERMPFQRNHCPVAIEAAPPAGVLAFLDVSSIGDMQLALLHVENGQLRIERLLDDPDQNWSMTLPRFMDARIAGWSRVLSPQLHTVMIAHAPFHLVDLGYGELLDIENDVAFLIDRSPPAEGIAATFRAVRLSDGTQLARLEMPSRCLTLPELELEQPNDLSVMQAYIRFDDVPAWRRQVLRWMQDDPVPLQPAVPCESGS